MKEFENLPLLSAKEGGVSFDANTSPTAASPVWLPVFEDSGTTRTTGPVRVVLLSRARCSVLYGTVSIQRHVTP